MKQIRIIIFSILFPAIILNNLYAQQKYCEINVQDGKEPLEFANIFINGKYFGCTDSSGNLSVPVWLLKNGDTLAAAFIGMEPDTCIFQGQAKQRFSLTPSTELFQVTKMASIRAFHRFYKKNVRVKLPLASRYAFNYKVIKHWNNRDYIRYEGKIKLSYVFYHYYSDSLFYQIDELKTSIGDTSMMKVVDILHMSFQVMYQLNNFSYWKNKISLKYLGENEKYRVFAWLYIQKQLPIQLLIFADKTSHLVQRLELHTVLTNDNQTRLILEYKYDEKQKRLGLIKGEVYFYPYSPFGMQKNYSKGTLNE